MSYPSHTELIGRAIRDEPALFARAPWFDSNAVAERVLWESYLDANRMLPGGVPERAVMSFEWRHRVAVPRGVLSVPRRMWWRGKWKQWQHRVRDPVVSFVESVADKLDLMEGPPVPAEYGFDLWRSRHASEAPYVRGLGELRGLVQVWTQMGVTADVHADAIIWRDRRLRADYKTAKKAELPFWSDTVRYERRGRSEYGYLIHWHNVEAEGLARSGLTGRYVPLPRWWRDWEVPAGCWAMLPPVLGYVGSAVIGNPGSGWWVVFCTGWALNVAWYIVWDAYDTRRLWWIPPRLLDAIRALPVRQVKDVLGEDGYRDLVRFLTRIEQTDWDGVPPWQNERPGGGAGRRGRQAGEDRSPGGRGYGADYLFVDPESGAVESSWTAKRRRACMYSGAGPFARVREHQERRGDGPRTFADAWQAAADALPSYEEVQARSERTRNAPMEVIVISDDEVESGPAVEDGQSVARVSPMPGSGDEGSSGTLEIDGRRRVVTEVKVEFTPGGVTTIREFLAAVMVAPEAGFAPDVHGLIMQLRGELSEIAGKVARGEQGAEAKLLGTSDASGEQYWFAEERAWFGLEKMNVVHRFLACVVTPPRGGFSLYLAGIRHQLIAHVRCLERDAARAQR